MSIPEAIRDRRAAVATECLRAELHARRRLPALVFRAIDEGNGAIDDVPIELLGERPRETAILLDYDGSLSPIVERPEAAVPATRPSIPRVCGSTSARARPTTT